MLPKDVQFSPRTTMAQPWRGRSELIVLPLSRRKLREPGFSVARQQVRTPPLIVLVLSIMSSPAASRKPTSELAAKGGRLVWALVRRRWQAAGCGGLGR